jgi:tol-pal system protein YbgF
MTLRRLIPARLAIVVACLACPVGPLETAPAWAQTVDTRQLLDRLERLQRDVDTLQRQVYRGQSPSTTPPVGPSSTDALSPQAIGRFDSRLSQIETELRFLTGKVEELAFAQEQQRRAVEKLQSDVELRLNALEQGRPLSAPQPTAQAPAAPSSPTAASRPTAAVPPPAASGQPGVLGTITQSQAAASAQPATPTAPQQAARPAPPASVLPDGSPQDQYRFAFNILLQPDYDQAERAFKAFVAKHPNDALAENARYWLGETYYVRDKFDEAAVAFAEAYQKAPNGSKAPDNLLKLAMSLGKVNKQREACATFAKMAEQFPNAPAPLKSRASTERQRLNCR